MTTVLYDSRSQIMASDSIGDFGGTPYTVTKIHRLKKTTHNTMNELYGASGTLGEGLLVREWLEYGGEKPRVSDTFHAILVNKNREMFHLEQYLFPVPVTEPFFAIGSGRDLALATLHHNLGAYEAIQTAIKFDVYTAGDVELLYLFEISDDVPF